MDQYYTVIGKRLEHNQVILVYGPRVFAKTEADYKRILQITNIQCIDWEKVIGSVDAWPIKDVSLN